MFLKKVRHNPFAMTLVCLILIVSFRTTGVYASTSGEGFSELDERVNALEIEVQSLKTQIQSLLYELAQLDLQLRMPLLGVRHSLHSLNSNAAQNPTQVLAEKASTRPEDDKKAEATHRYWEACRKLDIEYHHQLEQVLDLDDDDSKRMVVNAYEAAAELFFRWGQRERALTVQNVDPELTRLFVRGRGLQRRHARNLMAQAVLLRSFADYEGHDLMPTSEMESRAGHLTQEAEEIAHLFNDYGEDWETIRIALTEKYGRHFSADEE